jgi:hypothetical protein
MNYVLMNLSLCKLVYFQILLENCPKYRQQIRFAFLFNIFRFDDWINNFLQIIERGQCIAHIFKKSKSRNNRINFIQSEK